MPQIGSMAVPGAASSAGMRPSGASRKGLVTILMISVERITCPKVPQLPSGIPIRDSKKLNHPTWCIMRSRLTCAGGSTMELTDSLKALFIETATTLTGSARRLFMARTVKELGPGGQRRAERELGWNRETIRKGSREL